MAGSFVYLIEAENGLIKIGVSTDPLRRAKDFYIHSPVLVRLIAYWPGWRCDEQELHAQFADYRNHCEWFRNVGAFAEFVEAKRGSNVAKITDWAELTYYVTAKRERHRELIGEAQKRMWADPARRRERVLNRRTNILYKKRKGERAFHPYFDEELYHTVAAEVAAEYDAAHGPAAANCCGGVQ
jgi:hypothetical protein